MVAEVLERSSDRAVKGADLQDLRRASFSSDLRSGRQTLSGAPEAKVLSERGERVTAELSIPDLPETRRMRSDQYRDHLAQFARSIESKLAPDFSIVVAHLPFGDAGTVETFSLNRKTSDGKSDVVQCWARNPVSDRSLTTGLASWCGFDAGMSFALSLKEGAFFTKLEKQILKSMKTAMKVENN